MQQCGSVHVCTYGTPVSASGILFHLLRHGYCALRGSHKSPGTKLNGLDSSSTNED